MVIREVEATRDNIDVHSPSLHSVFRNVSDGDRGSRSNMR